MPYLFPAAVYIREECHDEMALKHNCFALRTHCGRMWGVDVNEPNEETKAVDIGVRRTDGL